MRSDCMSMPCLFILALFLPIRTAKAETSSFLYPNTGTYRLRFLESRRCLSGPIKLNSQDGYGMSIRSTLCVASSGGVSDQHFFLPEGWDKSRQDPLTGPMRLLESRFDFGMCVNLDNGLRPMYGNCMLHHAHSWHIHALAEGHITMESPETGRCLVDEERSDYVRMGDCSSPRAVLEISLISR